MLRPILVRSGAKCRLMAPCLSGSFGRKKANPQGSGRFVRVNTCGVSSYGAKLTVRRLRGAAQGLGAGPLEQVLQQGHDDDREHNGDT